MLQIKTYRLHLAALFAGMTALLLLSGCASSKATLETGEPEQTNVVSTVSATTATNAVPYFLDGPVLANGQELPHGPISRQRVAIPERVREETIKPKVPAGKSADAVPQVAPPDSSPSAKAWEIKLKMGSELAVIDGVLVYLSEPAIALDAKGKKLAVQPVDQKSIIAPLKTAHTNPISQSRPLRVFIDPGHGGGDPGARSKNLKLSECDLVLDISKRLAELLRNAGFDVRLSRNGPSISQTLEGRAENAFRWKADVFLSIHINASTSSSPNGFETYILPALGMKNSNGRLPGNAHDVRNMQLGYAIQRRALKTSGYVDRGLRRARFTVLREAKMPAALIECGFISSGKDIKLLETSSGRERIALGIYQGLCDYAYGTMSPGLAAHPVVDPNTIKPGSLAKTSIDIAPREIVKMDDIEAWKPPEYKPNPNEDPVVAETRRRVEKAAGL